MNVANRTEKKVTKRKTSVTNKRKETVCNKYRLYMNIIYRFGNKVMLMKQLFQYAEALGLVKSQPQFHSQIQELIEADILRQEPFVAFGKTTQLHMLTMRKYAIRYVEGKTDSQSVGAVPKANTNERILVSIFKNSYILDKIIPRLKKQGSEVSFQSINVMQKDDRSTIPYNKNKGLDYLSTLDDAFLNKYFNLTLLNAEIKDMELLRNKKNTGLKLGSEASKGKGKGKVSSSELNVLVAVQNRHFGLIETEHSQKVQNKKDRKLYSYNLDSMLNAYAYISQMKEIKDVMHITVLIFDINNKQDEYSIGTQIASIYHMFYRYFDFKFKLKVGIICFDEEAQSNMKAESKRKVKDRITKEPKGEMLKVTLQNWNVSEDMQKKHIEVIFSHYDLTNRYLEGIKYSNLVKK